MTDCVTADLGPNDLKTLPWSQFGDISVIFDKCLKKPNSSVYREPRLNPVMNRGP